MKNLRIHYFQHVPFEGIAHIETWAKRHDYKLSYTRFYAGDSIPDIDDIDWLIIMGGPMSPFDENEYPWLREEKIFIKKAIEHEKVVIGFCLGGQLISHVLGGKVYHNEEKEIGWFPIHFSDDIKNIPAFYRLTEMSPIVFHWHQDTFEIPIKAKRIASSAGCKNQVFLYGDKVFAFQCHFEITSTSMKNLIVHCPEDYATSGKFVQQPQEMFDKENTEKCNRLLETVLNNIVIQNEK